jgi:serine/threonine protein kinase
MRYVQHVFHAAGGLGEVYKAQDAELGRQVALKRMKRDVARHAESRRRFLREAEITGRLEHPGIVPVYGLVEDQDGQPCYAMRFIEGESLKDAIVRFHRRRAQSADNPMSAGEETLEFRKLLNHFIAACNTIAYAHCRGILHRDLKPDNIMLGPYGETLVVDWGLAEVFAGEISTHRWLAAFDIAPQLPIVSPLELGVNLDTDASVDKRKPESKRKSPSETVNEEAIADFLLAQGDGHDKDSGAEGTDKNAAKHSYAFVDKGSSELTQPGRAIGTLAFMSPEQAAGRLDLMGPASDVYSLGATLYFLLTGKSPFSESDVGQILQEVVEGPFYPARQNRHVPRALEAICSKAMRLKPEDRYPSAGALAGEIERWLADEPVSAWREPISLQIKRWVRRHTALVAAAASLLVTATIGLAVGIVLLNEKQKIAEDARQQAIEKLELGETLAGMMRLANSYAEAGSTDESIKLREETFQLVKAKLDNEPYTLQSMKSLAMSYYCAGRTQEALKLGEETLQLVKTKHGPDDPETLSSMNDLGIFYAAVGRNQEALKLREETLQLRRAKLGSDHPDTLVSMNNLAKSYHTAGRTQEAIKLQEETLQLRKAKLSPEHYDTLFSMNNLANSYIAEGAVGKALAILQDTLALRERRVKAEPGNSVERSLDENNRTGETVSGRKRGRRSLGLESRSTGSSRQNRPSIGSRGGRGGGVQPVTGKPIGWPRSLIRGSILSLSTSPCVRAWCRLVHQTSPLHHRPVRGPCPLS